MVFVSSTFLAREKAALGDVLRGGSPGSSLQAVAGAQPTGGGQVSFDTGSEEIRGARRNGCGSK